MPSLPDPSRILSPELGSLIPGEPASPQTDPLQREPDRGPLPFLILASTSPRRTQLLTEAGIPHLAVDPQVDDALLSPSLGLPGQTWASSLAYLKAAAAAKRLASLPEAKALPPHPIVLGADTVVIKERDLIGKPTSAADAAAMIARLAGGTHQVTTGVTLLCPATGRRRVFHDTASVSLGPLPPETIEQYVRSGQWKGKAGGYNLFERAEAGWPIRWEGDPTTVVGLPMQALRQRLWHWCGGDARA